MGVWETHPGTLCAQTPHTISTTFNTQLIRGFTHTVSFCSPLPSSASEQYSASRRSGQVGTLTAPKAWSLRQAYAKGTCRYVPPEAAEPQTPNVSRCNRVHRTGTHNRRVVFPRPFQLGALPHTRAKTEFEFKKETPYMRHVIPHYHLQCINATNAPMQNLPCLNH